MLDNISKTLLDILVNECDNNYKVLELEYLKMCFPEYMNMTSAIIRDNLKILADREYISLSYEDDTAVCVRPLMKGRVDKERRIDDEIERESLSKSYFKYSFMGSLTGGFIVALVMLIIFLLLR